MATLWTSDVGFSGTQDFLDMNWDVKKNVGKDFQLKNSNLFPIFVLWFIFELVSVLGFVKASDQGPTYQKQFLFLH